MITKKDTEMGMMGKTFDNSFDGMLFMMGDGDHSFWMKNCIIPLDIIFIKNKKVNIIHHNCEPCRTNECERYSGDGDMILELEGGACRKYDIVEGDRVYFN